LQKLDNSAPNGFVGIKSFAKKNNISTSYVYALIKQHKIETKTFGGCRRRFFFNEKQVEKLLGKKRNKYKSLKKRASVSFKSRYKGYEDFLSSVV